jgi:hypothetical protein
MGCPICKNLEQAYEALLSEYNEARSSAGYQVCRRLAAKKKVDMERARYELEEHRSVCVSAGVSANPPEEVPSKSLGRVAA